MAKSFSKSKDGKNQTGPGFRTSDHFLSVQAGKGSIFSGGKSKFSSNNQPKFNPAQFKTQHKG